MKKKLGRKGSSGALRFLLQINFHYSIHDNSGTNEISSLQPHSATGTIGNRRRRAANEDVQSSGRAGGLYQRARSLTGKLVTKRRRMPFQTCSPISSRSMGSRGGVVIETREGRSRGNAPGSTAHMWVRTCTECAQCAQRSQAFPLARPFSARQLEGTEQ
jgi:hypothetical protein